jgi:hypothetical protein
MILYATATGCTNIDSISVSDSHGAATSSVTVNCVSTTLDIGDYISIDLGYTTNHSVQFTGYVKQIDRKSPDNMYTISAQNILSRAVDFYIVSANPETPFSVSNASAESLVMQVLALANLTSFNTGTSYINFGTESPVEVSLVSAFDYSKQIADMIAWNLWADSSGVTHFRNRKPFPVDAAYIAAGGEPDLSVDTATGVTITDPLILNANYTESNQNLMNRVVVYGAESITSEAKASSPYLPNTGGTFYKTVLFSDIYLITNQSVADKASSYNLLMLNRLNKNLELTILGDPARTCRTVCTINSTEMGLSGDWYIFSINQEWSKSGFTTNMSLRVQ